MKLKFDRIRPRFLRSLNDPNRLLKALIVVGGKLGNDER